MKKKMYREIYHKPVEEKTEIKTAEKPKKARKKKGDK